MLDTSGFAFDIQPIVDTDSPDEMVDRIAAGVDQTTSLMVLEGVPAFFTEDSVIGTTMVSRALGGLRRIAAEADSDLLIAIPDLDCDGLRFLMLSSDAVFRLQESGPNEVIVHGPGGQARMSVDPVRGVLNPIDDERTDNPYVLLTRELGATLPQGLS